MAKKSKTQRAKASAARQARKAEREESLEIVSSEESTGTEAETEEPKRSFLKKASKEDSEKKPAEPESKKAVKKADDKKPKKQRFQFFRDVKAEMKRVTWPTRADVLRWSGVVVAALIFFGVFVAVLDNLIVTPLLILISGADPASIDWMSVFTGGDFNGSGAEASGADSSAADVSSDASSVDASTDGASDAPSAEGEGGETADQATTSEE